MQVLIIDTKECPECGSKNILLKKRSEMYCHDCGYVIQDQIPVIEAQKGHVEAVYVNKKRKKIAVVINGILESRFEKKMKPFYAELKKISIPKHIEAEVIMLCKKAVELKITMSYSKTELLAGLIYIVSRRYGLPMLANDLTRIFSISKKDLFRVAKFVARKLELKANSVDVENCIIRVTSDLNVERLSGQAIAVSRTLDISNPLLKSAVSIWIATKNAKIKIKKRALARACNVSEPALRKNIKKWGLKI